MEAHSSGLIHLSDVIFIDYLSFEPSTCSLTMRYLHPEAKVKVLAGKALDVERGPHIADGQ